MSRWKELDVDRKSIQEIELVGQLKKLNANGNATDAGNNQSNLTILEKIKETRLNFSKRSVTVL